jgi:cell division transport system permease protein
VLTSRLVDHGTAQWKHGVSLEIFMNTNATNQQTDSVRSALKASKDVRSYRYLSKDDAYKEFKRLFSDQPDLVSSIDASVLPASFRVAPTRPELTETVAARFRHEAGVNSVATPAEAVKRLLSITSVLKKVFYGTFALLLAAALFLIVNTIRLATFARRREIEVMKLVGASNWFVRIPFMLEGMIQGLIGAAFAFGAVYGLKVLLSDFIDRNSQFARGFAVSNADAMTIGIGVLVLGALIGVAGSMIGLRRFIEV